MPKVPRLAGIATGARRRRTEREKRRIVAESFDEPRRLSATARLQELSPSPRFTRRQQIEATSPAAETLEAWIDKTASSVQGGVESP